MSVIPETMLTVVSAALYDPQGRVLMTKRKQTSNRPGMWEYPGGKVERNEGLRHAIIRELGEELGIEVTKGYFPLGSYRFDLECSFITKVYAAPLLPEHNPQALESDELRMVDPREAIVNLPMLPSCYLAYRELIKWLDQETKNSPSEAV